MLFAREMVQMSWNILAIQLILTDLALSLIPNFNSECCLCGATAPAMRDMWPLCQTIPGAAHA
jgi:hypothetical protein